MWVGLKDDNALWSRHLNGGIDSVDDCRKLKDERPP
jgi:hypothetical protein